MCWASFIPGVGPCDSCRASFVPGVGPCDSCRASFIPKWPGVILVEDVVSLRRSLCVQLSASCRTRAPQPGPVDQVARLSETIVAFARWYLCGIETAIAFAGEK